jgi:L-amino-acid oxidase
MVITLVFKKKRQFFAENWRKSTKIMIITLITPRKANAIRSVTFSSASKVVLAFKYPFWERENGHIKNGGSVKTDLPVRQIYYPQKSTEYGIIICRLPS